MPQAGPHRLHDVCHSFEKRFRRVVVALWILGQDIAGAREVFEQKVQQGLGGGETKR